jgi:hypothetical protein
MKKKNHQQIRARRNNDESRTQARRGNVTGCSANFKRGRTKEISPSMSRK